MKKIWLILAGVLLLVGCTTQNAPANTSNQSTKPNVTVTTSFLKDMVKQLAGDAVTVESLIPAGEDPHLYIAKASDLKKLQNAKLVLYHGLHFEGKMVDALEKSGTAVSKEFPKDQLQTLDEDGEVVTDPHFWFNIKLYKLAVETASKELVKLLPNEADKIKANTTAYLKQLDELDAWIKAELAKIPEETRYLITPHDAFNYFSKAYGVSVHAPQGVSTDSEVDNKAMIETVDLIIAKKVKAIFAESTTNPERMEKLKAAVEAKGGSVTVVRGDGEELLSDSLAPEGEKGDTYIEMYKHNINLMVKYLK
ncbi:zinc ABC transporter substrate-binding protein [Carnobacteriaceae bacterium zg-ZUI252]|nr:zinc ABC transporter substrate-binding protein [Carnobacteriaceae bacterium zg-ZUI252]MBS4770465.1 zinc ABC transporter substrate-binding protein [Carnobacteriaceae bacterium zg-ZUI240]QTU82842.1 zinc ABC transporter substrate-binding protein [Carnobacteriaceae bacterium zg-C25]